MGEGGRILDKRDEGIGDGGLVREDHFSVWWERLEPPAEVTVGAASTDRNRERQKEKYNIGRAMDINKEERGRA